MGLTADPSGSQDRSFRSEWAPPAGSWPPWARCYLLGNLKLGRLHQDGSHGFKVVIFHTWLWFGVTQLKVHAVQVQHCLCHFMLLFLIVDPEKCLPEVMGKDIVPKPSLTVPDWWQVIHFWGPQQHAT
jgi:hypothetical protein